MRKAIVIIISFMMVVVISGMGSKTEAEDVETGLKPVSETAGAGLKPAEPVNKGIPGVTEEVSADGVRTITINLSEIDESKLPEKYEAEVILEAPIVMGEQRYIREKKKMPEYDRFEEVYKGVVVYSSDGRKGGLTGKSATPSGIFLTMPEGGPHGGFDVSIDEEGNIYILDLYNSRIQKFNSKGKHIRDIPIKDGYIGEIKKVKERITENGYVEREKWVIESSKNEIAGMKDRIFVRDKVKNKIETLDEEGNVLEVIDIPEKIDGKDSREMKMWADEEGVGVGGWRKGTVKGKENINIKDISKQKKQINVDKYLIEFNTKNEIFKFKLENIDNKGNIYFSVATKGNGAESGYYKITSKGILLAKIEVWPYWTLSQWTNDCIWRGALKESVGFDKNGNIYVFYVLCCQDKSCLGKIRVIKLTSKKGNK